MSREDHVIRVEHPDGTIVCDHADGTRITQYTRDIEKPMFEAEAEEGNTNNGPLSLSLSLLLCHCPCVESYSIAILNMDCGFRVSRGFNQCSTNLIQTLGCGPMQICPTLNICIKICSSPCFKLVYLKQRFHRSAAWLIVYGTITVPKLRKSTSFSSPALLILFPITFCE